MARSSSATSKDSPTEISFEEAIANLEAIVEAMEHDQLPLGELVNHYEKGTALLNTCETLLKAAKGRIELITLRNQAEIGLESQAEPVQLAGPVSDTTSPSDDPDDDDDIRLF
jgi:exodeoxyribonuclease VII small subunit